MDDKLDFFKKIRGYQYSIFETALFINDENPIFIKNYTDIKDESKAKRIDRTVLALKRDIQDKELNAQTKHKKSRFNYYELDINLTTIHENDIIQWLQYRNFKPSAFFPHSSKNEHNEKVYNQDYLNPDKPERYSAKLHAAVSAWMAMEGESFSKTKTPKRVMIEWIKNRFPKLSNNAVKAAAEVANWK